MSIECGPVNIIWLYHKYPPCNLNKLVIIDYTQNIKTSIDYNVNTIISQWYPLSTIMLWWYPAQIRRQPDSQEMIYPIKLNFISIRNTFCSPFNIPLSSVITEITEIPWNSLKLPKLPEITKITILKLQVFL